MSVVTRAWARPAWSFVGLLVAYFAFPTEWGGSALGMVLSLLLTVAGLGILGRMMVLELQHLRTGETGWTTSALTLVLVIHVMVFSLAFYILNLLDPDQVTGLETRVDALYFTLSTMSTVGYGDVHAEGQLARAIVCGLIVFSVVVVASLLRAHTRAGRSDD